MSVASQKMIEQVILNINKQIDDIQQNLSRSVKALEEAKKCLDRLTENHMKEQVEVKE